MKINENTLARDICAAEGGKVSVSIGQVKEILKLTLNELAAGDPYEVMALIRKHRKKSCKCFVSKVSWH